MHTYEGILRVYVNGNYADVRTQIRAANYYEAELLLKAQYGEQSFIGLRQVD
jgi:hypothetical protein